MGGGTVFSLSDHTSMGKGGGYPIWLTRVVPIPGLDGGYPVPGLNGGGGALSQVWTGVPHPRSGWGGTPSQVQTGGYSIWLMGGTPSQVWMGDSPSQVWMGYPIPHMDGGHSIPGLDRGYPIPGLDGGYPIPGLDGGYPISGPDWEGTPSGLWGYPIPGLDGGTPSCWQGDTPSKVRTGVSWDTPQHWDWMGVSPSAVWGTPHQGLDGVPPCQQDGVPSSRTGWSSPRQETDSIASTCYTADGVPLASCVHAGGLSCLFWV